MSEKKAKQVIVVRTDLPEFIKNRGKVAAQVAHASLGSLLSISKRSPEGVFIPFERGSVEAWLDFKFTKVCLDGKTLENILIIKDLVEKAGLPHALITDAGDTVFKEPTVTCLGIGPAWPEDIDPFTGSLKLFR